MIPDFRQKLRQWGNDFSLEMLKGTQSLYMPHVPLPDEALVKRDLAYGPDERHRLDLFLPSEPAGAAPIIIFVHGGGFVIGSKGAPSDPYHNNIGAWAAGSGFSCAIINYRLAPTHRWPAGRDDVLRAAHFLVEQKDLYGGDGRIFLLGQSAGATHVADAVAADDGPDATITGAMMISGIYDPGLGEPDQFQLAYYGDVRSERSSAASLPQLPFRRTATLYAVSELDPPAFQAQAGALVDAHIGETGRWPAILWLEGHNHLSSICQIGSDIDDLGPRLRDFVRSRPGDPGGPLG